MGEVAQQVLAEIQRIAASELEYAGPVLPDHELKRDLNLDSMAMIVVAVGLENRFRVKLQENDAEQIVKVADLVKLVVRRVEESRS